MENHDPSPDKIVRRTELLNLITVPLKPFVKLAKKYTPLEDYDIHLADHTGHTLLHYAAEAGNYKYAQFLLSEHRFEVDPRDARGRTPLMLALEADCGDTVWILLAFGADVDAVMPPEGDEGLPQLSVLRSVFVDPRDHSPRVVRAFVMHLKSKCASIKEAARKLTELGCHFVEAAGARDERLLRLMMTPENRAGQPPEGSAWSALHEAVDAGHLPSVRLLLANGAEVNALDDEGATPLFYAYNERILWNECSERLQVLKALIEAGASLVTCMPEGVFHAGPVLTYGDRAALQLLLSSPLMNIDARDQRDKSLLNYALECGHLEQARLLIDAGIEMDSEDLYTACQAESYECVELLLRAGLDTQLLMQSNKDQRVFTLFDVVEQESTIQRLLVQHLAISEEGGSEIADFNVVAIESRPWLSRYLDRCRRVLRANVCGTLSVFRIVTVGARRMATLLNYDELRLELKWLGRSKKLKAAFPFYYRMTRKRVRRAMYWRRMKQKAALVICAGLRCRLHPRNIIVEKIMDYLTEEDFKNLQVVSKNL